jgi:hypothetical protein
MDLDLIDDLLDQGVPLRVFPRLHGTNNSSIKRIPTVRNNICVDRLGFFRLSEHE